MGEVGVLKGVTDSSGVSAPMVMDRVARIRPGQLPFHPLSSILLPAGHPSLSRGGSHMFQAMPQLDQPATDSWRKAYHEAVVAELEKLKKSTKAKRTIVMPPLQTRWSTRILRDTDRRPLLWPITAWMCANLDVQQANHMSMSAEGAVVDCSQRAAWRKGKPFKKDVTVGSLLTSTRLVVDHQDVGLGFVSPVEAFMLQGFPETTDITFLDAQSSFALAGEAMHLSVLTAPLTGVLWALGVYTPSS